jgi:hypothetical protein
MQLNQHYHSVTFEVSEIASLVRLILSEVFQLAQDALPWTWTLYQRNTRQSCAVEMLSPWVRSYSGTKTQFPKIACVDFSFSLKLANLDFVRTYQDLSSELQKMHPHKPWKAFLTDLFSNSAKPSLKHHCEQNQSTQYHRWR